MSASNFSPCIAPLDSGMPDILIRPISRVHKCGYRREGLLRAYRIVRGESPLNMCTSVL
jgi:hypothetical protein